MSGWSSIENDHVEIHVFDQPEKRSSVSRSVWCDIRSQVRMAHQLPKPRTSIKWARRLTSWLQRNSWPRRYRGMNRSALASLDVQRLGHLKRQKKTVKTTLIEEAKTNLLSWSSKKSSGSCATPRFGSISCKRQKCWAEPDRILESEVKILLTIANKFSNPWTFVGTLLNFWLNASDKLWAGSVDITRTFLRTLDSWTARLQLKSKKPVQPQV